MKEKTQIVANHSYFKRLEEGSAANITFHWEGRRISVPHWDFKWIFWSVPEVEILFKTMRVTFKPPEDFELQVFLEAFQLLRVTNLFQREQMKLDVEVFDHDN